MSAGRIFRIERSFAMSIRGDNLKHVLNTWETVNQALL